jgi:hypothetical protein
MKASIPAPRRTGAPRKHGPIYDRLLKLAVNQHVTFKVTAHSATEVRGVTKYLTLRGTFRYATRTDEQGNTTVWRIQ